MAELTINAADIAAALQKNLEGFSPSLETTTIGRVMNVGDGIARISGLPKAGVNELLEFENGLLGLALNLDEDSIGAVVLGDAEGIDEGQSVKATGRILEVPVGDGVLGRVVNALGEPIDGKGPLVGTTARRMEIQAPGIIGRQKVHQPMQTGRPARPRCASTRS
jgi:F-type H+/Na+-transporting ATPase subunit alpha